MLPLLQSFCTWLTYGRKKLYIYDVQNDQRQVDFVQGLRTRCTDMPDKSHKGSGHFVRRSWTKCFKMVHRFLERFR